MQLKKIGQLVLKLDDELKSVNAKVHGTSSWIDLSHGAISDEEERTYLLSFDSDIFYISAGTFIAGGIALYNGTATGGGSFAISGQLVNTIEPSSLNMYAKVDTNLFPFVMKLSNLKSICNFKVETNQSVSYVAGKNGVSEVKINVYLFM